MLQLITLPILLLNTFAGIVAVIWLAILGQWSHLFGGIACMVAMPFVFGILSLPGMGFAVLGTNSLEKGSMLVGGIAAFLASLWTTVLLTAWCCLVAGASINDIADSSAIPFLLGGYAVAMAPIGYMAQKEQGNTYSGIQSFMCQVFYVLLILNWACSGPAWIYLLLIAVNVLAFPIVTVFFLGAASAEQRAFSIRR